MTTTDAWITIYADALALGDHIVGDRMYPNGSLDFRVKGVIKTRPGMVTVVKGLLGPHQIEGTITYANDDSVTVIPAGPKTAGA